MYFAKHWFSQSIITVVHSNLLSTFACYSCPPSSTTLFLRTRLLTLLRFLMSDMYSVRRNLESYPTGISSLYLSELFLQICRRDRVRRILHPVKTLQCPQQSPPIKHTEHLFWTFYKREDQFVDSLVWPEYLPSKIISVHFSFFNQLCL